MFKFSKKYNDFIPTSEERKVLAKSLRGVVNGSVLSKKEVVRELPFLVLLFVMAMVSIANGYYYMKTYREMVTLEKEVEELRIESLSLASDFMRMSKQSEVIKRIKEEKLNLEESLRPPYKIYLKDGK